MPVMSFAITEEQRELYRTEGYLILPAVIPPAMLTMLREDCSYYLGYYDSLMDAKGTQTENLSHQGQAVLHQQPVPAEQPAVASSSFRT